MKTSAVRDGFPGPTSIPLYRGYNRAGNRVSTYTRNWVEVTGSRHAHWLAINRLTLPPVERRAGLARVLYPGSFFTVLAFWDESIKEATHDVSSLFLLPIRIITFDRALALAEDWWPIVFGRLTTPVTKIRDADASEVRALG